MFGLKKKRTCVDLVSPIKGKMIDLKEVPDQVFASGMMGQGVAFLPIDGKVYSPCNGKLVTVFPTKHALGIKADNGAELLIHFGLDTVQLNGEFFDQKIEVGKKVKKGDLILDVDIKMLEEKGYKTVTPMIITNSDEFNINMGQYEDVEVNDKVIITLEKK